MSSSARVCELKLGVRRWNSVPFIQNQYVLSIDNEARGLDEVGRMSDDDVVALCKR